MKSSLPIILGAGVFDSRKRFWGKKITEPRNVNCFELELFCEDSGVTIVNGKSFAVKKGNILLSRPKDVRRTVLHTKCLYVHFMTDDERILPLLGKIPTFSDADYYPELSKFFKNIKHFMFDGSEFACVPAAGELLKLIYYVSTPQSILKTDKITAPSDPILSGIDFIRNNYTNDISVNEVANSCNLSVSHFYKLFLKQTGTTPNQFILNCRLFKAKELLINQDIPIFLVAEKSGFSSVSYFCYCFKKETGMPPAKFRSIFYYPE